jgi:hypothetical protein
MAHTPGPWHVIDSYRDASESYKQTHPRDILILAEDPGVASIAEVASIPPSSPQAIHDRELANARVMAAAPDLLAVVKEFCRLDVVQRATQSTNIGLANAADHALSAIAKAEGR